MSNCAPEMMAGGNIYPNRFCIIDSGNDFKVLQGTANAVLLGVSNPGSNYAPLNDQSVSAYHAQAGDAVRLFTAGDICLVEAGGNIVRGDRLKSDANGKAVSIATSGTTPQRIGGIALQSGAAGEHIKIQVRLETESPA